MARARARSSPDSLAAAGTTAESGDAGLITGLRDVLGQDLTALVAGVAPAGALDRLVDDDREPAADVVDRLRMARAIVELLLEVESPAVVRAWFNGMNPLLGDRSPAAVIADDPALVLRAARAFRAYG